MKTILYSLTFATVVAIVPALAHADVTLSVSVAPPALPVYVQPPIPGDGYIWTPGYWAWGPDINDYYWVPGTWVLAPTPGMLWTPGYWGWINGNYMWHGGYWGPQIGYYGGINYGFGYVGVGYAGGHWDHGVFNYNSSVNNIGNIHVANVYNQTVINNTAVRVSYNGGSGGIQARPTRQEERAANMPHIAPTGMQMQHEQTAQMTPDLRASFNHGAPRIAATPRPGAFSGPSIPAAKAGSPYVMNRPSADRQIEQAAPQFQPHAAPHPQAAEQASRPQAMEQRPAPQEMHQQPRPGQPEPHPGAQHQGHEHEERQDR